MGVYEISLGDTVGVGTPESWGRLMDELKKENVDIGYLAVSFAAHLFTNTSLTRDDARHIATIRSARESPTSSRSSKFVLAISNPNV